MKMSYSNQLEMVSGLLTGIDGYRQRLQGHEIHNSVRVGIDELQLLTTELLDHINENKEKADVEFESLRASLSKVHLSFDLKDMSDNRRHDEVLLAIQNESKEKIEKLTTQLMECQ